MFHFTTCGFTHQKLKVNTLKLKSYMYPNYSHLIALRPVPVTSDQELSVIKSRIAELKAQLNREVKEKRSSTLDKDASFV